MKQCVIFGGGELTGEVHIPRSALVIAADSGYSHCQRLSLDPHVIIGDFDSFSGELPAAAQIIKAPPEKDDTDMMLAIRHALERGYKDITLYGAGDGRMGHTLANISALEFIEEHGGTGRIVDGKYIISVQSEGVREYTNDKYSYISLFSLTKSSEIMAEGLKYGGKIRLERAFPLGVSNEFISDKAVINVISGRILAVSEK